MISEGYRKYILPIKQSIKFVDYIIGIFMGNIKKLTNKNKVDSHRRMSKEEGSNVVSLEKKINDAIQKRLEKFVKEIQELKIKQKRLEAKKKNQGSLKAINKNKKSKKPK